jgi:hypothetical protein
MRSGGGCEQATRRSLLLEVGDITLERQRAYRRPSGDHVRHRLSGVGNRQINRTLHIMATDQLRNPAIGRDSYDRKKAGGNSSMEAMRCLEPSGRDR